MLSPTYLTRLLTQGLESIRDFRYDRDEPPRVAEGRCGSVGARMETIQEEPCCDCRPDHRWIHCFSGRIRQNNCSLPTKLRSNLIQRLLPWAICSTSSTWSCAAIRNGQQQLRRLQPGDLRLPSRILHRLWSDRCGNGYFSSDRPRCWILRGKN